eukprot:m.26832 g.26832  ORF g.26832 m.26832 type:complete len:81 (-) comp39043_c0_seq1:229-471(-)
MIARSQSTSSNLLCKVSPILKLCANLQQVDLHVDHLGFGLSLVEVSFCQSPRRHPDLLEIETAALLSESVIAIRLFSLGG